MIAFYLLNCFLVNQCKLFIQRRIKLKWIDATNFHPQTSKANKAEVRENEKKMSFSRCTASFRCGLLPSWGRRNIQKMRIMHLDGPIKRFSSTGMLIMKQHGGSDVKTN